MGFGFSGVAVFRFLFWGLVTNLGSQSSDCTGSCAFWILVCHVVFGLC